MRPRMGRGLAYFVGWGLVITGRLVNISWGQSEPYWLPADVSSSGPTIVYSSPAVPPELLPPAGATSTTPLLTPAATGSQATNPAVPGYRVAANAHGAPIAAETWFGASLYGPPPVPEPAAPKADAPWPAGTGQRPAESCGLPMTAWDGSVCGDWFGGIYGLVMTRANENDVWLSYNTAFPDYKALASRHADMDWGGGFETRLGRYFNCGANAWELVYWGLFPNVREANVCDCTSIGTLRTWLPLDNLVYDPGTGNQPVRDFFDDAERHRLLRSFQFHNVELNLLSFIWPVHEGACTYQATLGARYLRFDEGLEFASDPVDDEFTGDPREMAYTIDVINHLIGAQFGGRLTYLPADRVRLFADLKLGLFGNHIRHRSSLGGSNGFAVVDNPGGPYDGEIIDIRSTKDDVAMLGELALGGSYQLTRYWSLTGGYRAVALTGVALSTNQIPLDNIWTVDSVREIDSNGSLILHGVFAGMTFNY